MKLLVLFLLAPLCSIAQFETNAKLPFKATLVSDTGTITGYYVYSGDSSVILSPKNRYSENSAIKIPVNSIREMHLKNKKSHLGLVAAGAVFGFILTAGLIQNNDYNNDGKTSFFELVWSAIEGTTSRNRQRRVASLIAGGVGGTAFMLAGLLTSRKFSLVFPIQNRNNFYNEKRGKLNDYLKF